MQLHILAIGRLKPGPERDLAGRYRERATQSGRGLGVSGPDISEFSESRARRPEDRKSEEGGLLVQRTGAGMRILLDERGESMGSDRFAQLLADARDAGRPAACFIIGADGLDPCLHAGGHLALSFGALTLPHQLVRVLVLEQIYRAMTILSGHPYHRS